MRVMLTIQLDTEKANQAIRDKTLADTMKSALGRLNPESAYFGAQDGVRTAFIVFDLNDPSDIPPIAEPFFQQLGAKLSVIPVMTFDDVQTGLEKSS